MSTTKHMHYYCLSTTLTPWACQTQGLAQESTNSMVQCHVFIFRHSSRLTTLLKQEHSAHTGVAPNNYCPLVTVVGSLTPPCRRMVHCPLPALVSRKGVRRRSVRVGPLSHTTPPFGHAQQQSSFSLPTHTAHTHTHRPEC